MPSIREAHTVCVKSDGLCQAVATRALRFADSARKKFGKRHAVCVAVQAPDYQPDRGVSLTSLLQKVGTHAEAALM
ncbi:hypothetical protein GCM10022212_19130 [Actimicrobium antarcticum]|uniref:Uncharacterized protein n=1 Tax=Actimicrobium antarcticum TaxID=1051899 RepID=A0ABP7T7G7_9BURK